MCDVACVEFEEFIDACPTTFPRLQPTRHSATRIAEESKVDRPLRFLSSNCTSLFKMPSVSPFGRPPPLKAEVYALPSASDVAEASSELWDRLSAKTNSKPARLAIAVEWAQEARLPPQLRAKSSTARKLVLWVQPATAEVSYCAKQPDHRRAPLKRRLGPGSSSQHISCPHTFRLLQRLQFICTSQ